MLYQNGESIVIIRNDGTKVRVSKKQHPRLAFAESMDVCISRRCDRGCAYCYAGCIPQGERANILKYKFWDTVHPYTEVAIAGNDLDNPQLPILFEKLKENKVFANLTVHQDDLLAYMETIEKWLNDGLIHGLGISMIRADENIISFANTHKNVVVHVIAGVITKEQMAYLANHDIKVLILGYKEKGRGTEYRKTFSKKVNDNMKWLEENIEILFPQFSALVFDNLAIEQLGLQERISKETWEKIYMGDEGYSSFYLDLVDGKFYKSSTEQQGFPMLDNVDDMFRKVQSI